LDINRGEPSHGDLDGVQRPQRRYEGSVSTRSILSSDPLHVGESRESSVNRMAFEPPLAIEYEVIEDDKKVRVLAVSQIS
jgi:hypothetical protein